MTLVLLSMVPSLVVFFIFQKFFVEGMNGSFKISTQKLHTAIFRRIKIFFSHVSSLYLYLHCMHAILTVSTRLVLYVIQISSVGVPSE